LADLQKSVFDFEFLILSWKDQIAKSELKIMHQ